MLGNKYVAGAVGIILALVIAYNVQFFMSKDKTSSPAENTQQTSTPQRVQKRSGSPPQGLSSPPQGRTSLVEERISVKQPEKPQSVSAVRSSGKEDKGVWKRDPFSLQAGADSKTAEMADDIRLMGIIKRDGKSHALINGKVYRVNDRIGRVVIKEIKQHSIVVLAEGKKQEISFDDYKVVKEKKK